MRLDQQRVANDNMRAKVQVLQLGLNEKKLKADMAKIRAEVSEIMSRTKVNDVQTRKIAADAFETELLNHYYYNNGRVPSSTIIKDIWNQEIAPIIGRPRRYLEERQTPGRSW